MYSCLSTRSKHCSQEKGQRFFKKSDENCQQGINLKERKNSQKTLVNIRSCQSTKHSKQLFQMNSFSLASLSKQIKNFKDLKENKENKFQNQPKKKGFSKFNKQSNKVLKLVTSVELPSLLTKSVSQTTMHKRMDQLKNKQQNEFRKKVPVQNKAMKESIQRKVQESKIKVSQFKLGKKLGSGRFGNVYMAEDKDTNTIYALKVMSKIKIKEADMLSQVFMEIKLQTYMNHPNILKLYGCFDDQKNIYLVLEYCSDCLFKQFRANKKLGQQDVAYYGKQMISALKYMHNESIIHRDIKPQNIMLENGVLKLADFGWSTYAPVYKRMTFCGTVDYVPPEIVEGHSYDQRVDIWALGVLLYELAAGFAPFQTKHQNFTYDKIVHSQCKFPIHFSKGLRDVVGRVLDKNPSKRPNLEQIQNGQWFEKYKSVGRYISKEIWSAWCAM